MDTALNYGGFATTVTLLCIHFIVRLVNFSLFSSTSFFQYGIPWQTPIHSLQQIPFANRAFLIGKSTAVSLLSEIESIYLESSSLTWTRPTLRISSSSVGSSVNDFRRAELRDGCEYACSVKRISSHLSSVSHQWISAFWNLVPGLRRSADIEAANRLRSFTSLPSIGAKFLNWLCLTKSSFA